MLHLLRPDEYRPSIFAIDLHQLKARGIRAIITDLDNTLVPWGTHQPTPQVEQWMAQVRAAGLAVCVVSNGSPARVREFAARLGVACVGGAGKPFPKAFRSAMRQLGTSPAETAVIGDQLFTDVLGGRRLGLYTILVRAVSPREFPATKLLRLMEWFALRYWQRRGVRIRD